MKRLNICMIGFGNAGKAFAKLLVEQKKIGAIEYDVRVTAISTRSKGTLIDHDGIDLLETLECVENTGKLSQSPMETMDSLQVIQTSKADVLIELSALSIEDGQPAISHIETAFKNGMHVITANKGPIAWKFKKLNQTAMNRGVQFLYETTVMDGTPVFNLVKYSLPGCKVESFRAILNSTTNFILEEMENGSNYDAAIKEAQRRGFAEADPSLDVDGWDAAAKTTALINVLMGGELSPMEIERTGISDITYEKISNAAKENKKIKLICEGRLENGRVKGIVVPTLVDANSAFGTLNTTSSILALKTDLMGEVVIIEKDPEIEQTAYGVFSDLLTLIKASDS